MANQTNYDVTPGPSNRSTVVRNTVRFPSAVYHQAWAAPTTASTTAYRSTGIAGPNTTTISVTRTGVVAGNFVFDGTLAAGTPDFPRNVVITVTHGSAVVAESGVITGIDVYGKGLTEAWSVTAGTTSKTFTGAKGFKRVDSVTITAASDASANTNVIGNGAVLGLDVKCSAGGTGAAFKEIAAGAIVTNGVFVAASTSAAADQRGTYAPNSAPNGANNYDVWIASDDIEQSAL